MSRVEILVVALSLVGCLVILGFIVWDVVVNGRPRARGYRPRHARPNPNSGASVARSLDRISGEEFSSPAAGWSAPESGASPDLGGFYGACASGEMCTEGYPRAHRHYHVTGPITEWKADQSRDALRRVALDEVEESHGNGVVEVDVEPRNVQGRHESSPSVGRPAASTASVDGGAEAATSSPDGPTVGEPTDTPAASLPVGAVSVVGPVGDGTHPLVSSPTVATVALGVVGEAGPELLDLPPGFRVGPGSLTPWQRRFLRRTLSPRAAEWVIARFEQDDRIATEQQQVDRIARAVDELVDAALEYSGWPNAHAIRIAPVQSGQLVVRIENTAFAEPDCSLRVTPTDPWSLR